jgi:hypothetical protein
VAQVVALQAMATEQALLVHQVKGLLVVTALITVLILTQVVAVVQGQLEATQHHQKVAMVEQALILIQLGYQLLV